MRACISSLLVLNLLAQTAAAQIAGAGRVIDGDTREIDGAIIRLHGIDAPETGQACGTAEGGDWNCGAVARARLAELIDAGDLACDPVARDDLGRVVARCRAADVDINARMIREGLAWAEGEVPTDLARSQHAARQAGRGVWQGVAQTAWDWRNAWEWRDADNWRAAAGAVDPQGCAIEGDVAATGERVYRHPDADGFHAVTIDPSTGQRRFCTEADAEAAGWTAANGR